MAYRALNDRIEDGGKTAHAGDKIDLPLPQPGRNPCLVANDLSDIADDIARGARRQPSDGRLGDAVVVKIGVPAVRGDRLILAESLNHLRLDSRGGDHPPPAKRSVVGHRRAVADDEDGVNGPGARFGANPRANLLGHQHRVGGTALFGQQKLDIPPLGPPVLNPFFQRLGKDRAGDKQNVSLAKNTVRHQSAVVPPRRADRLRRRAGGEHQPEKHHRAEDPRDVILTKSDL